MNVINLKDYVNIRIKKLLIKEEQTEQVRKQIRHLGRVKEFNKVG